MAIAVAVEGDGLRQGDAAQDYSRIPLAVYSILEGRPVQDLGRFRARARQ
jgi:hypothetical protein